MAKKNDANIAWNAVWRVTDDHPIFDWDVLKHSLQSQCG